MTLTILGQLACALPIALTHALTEIVPPVKGELRSEDSRSSKSRKNVNLYDTMESL